MIRLISLVLLLMLSAIANANNSGVTFTVSNVTQGSSSDTISFQMDSCEGCISGSMKYEFQIDHTPITNGAPGNPTIAFKNDTVSCIKTTTSYSITNQFLEPTLDSALNSCSTYFFTTHIQVNNLKVAGGKWNGGNLNCKVTKSGSSGLDCGSIYVPAFTPGHDIAAQLTADYNNAPGNCGTDASPSLLCSGIMIRGTQPSDDYHSWDPSPASVTSGGVSFSYLRKDSKFNKLAYGYTNGLIFYPQQEAPSDKVKIDTLCAFPIDSASENRSDKGCGEYSGHPESGICQSQNITNANQWFSHYQDYNYQHASECGFDLRNTTQISISAAFNETIKSMATIADESFNTQNELRVGTWSSDIDPTKLPLEAFFYLKGTNGLAGAQHDQKDFYQTTGGGIVPIVQIDLPDSAGQDVIFTYSPDDQVVPVTH